MAEYDKNLEKTLCNSLFYELDEEACISTLNIKKSVENLLNAGVTIPVRCRHCKFYHWAQEPCHGKAEYFVLY